MQDGHGDLRGPVLEQLAQAVLQGDAGIVHLVDEQDLLAGKLLFHLVDPLDGVGARGGLVVRAVVGDAHGEDRLLDEGLEDPGGDESAGSDGDDQVGVEPGRVILSASARTLRWMCS